MTTKKEVSPSPPRNSSSDDYILVAVLLVILQLAHELRFGWIVTGLAFAGYILGDTLVKVIRKKREEVTPTGYVISKRGNYWEITFENTKAQVSVTLSDTQFLKFTAESSQRLEAAHGS